MSAPRAHSDWTHDHIFDQGNRSAEKNTLLVVIVTAVTMVGEIAAGWWFNSMALLADGWHMSSHALALGLSLLAYRSARRLHQDQRFCFGTWKIEVLAAYTSAILLSMVAALMFFESTLRLINPETIQYNQAIFVAVLGLLVNLASVWLLGDGGHHHDHGDHGHDHHHQDLNLKAAYIHVLTDAATSVLAIVALLGGKYYAASWLDPIMGIAGAILVGVWAWGLVKQSAAVLLDAEMDQPPIAEIRTTVAHHLPHATLTDLHVWRVGKTQYAAIISLSSDQAHQAETVKTQLRAAHPQLAHITVEFNPVTAPRYRPRLAPMQHRVGYSAQH